MNRKLNYSPKLRAMLESFLEGRKHECFMNVLHAVCYTFFFISIFKEVASLVYWFLYVFIMIECVAFFRLYSVDNILRPRFVSGVMLTWYSEKKLFLRWAEKKGPREFREANFLISEVFEKSFGSYPDKEEEEE
jgi:hypothetical protein